MDAGGQVPAGQDCSSTAFDKKYGYKPEWGADNAYMQFAIWARMVSEAGTFYPPDVIKQYEKGETFPSTVGDVHFRAATITSSSVRSSSSAARRQGHEEQGGLLGGRRGRARRRLMQKPDAFGCKLGDYT